MFTTDLSNCDREPIHIPGKVQGHGFLIGIDQQYMVTYCSENISDFLPAEPSILLGKTLGQLDAYLEKTDPPDFLIQLIKLSNRENGFEPPNPYPLKIRNEIFNVILSQSGDHYLLEFEPEISSLRSDLSRLIGGSLSEMLGDADLSKLLNNAAEQIKKVIGYDRVMIYKFHDDGHGEVVSEVKEDHLEPFLGLHYPATDIPKQARELYKTNLTRLIANVHTEPSRLLANSEASGPLDLTNSSLRAVSPIHIEYLKNMGVESSFSISLIHQGELWGLIACHNYTPRFINYKERQAAKLIGQVLSSALSFRVQEEAKHKSGRFSAAVDTLTKQLLRDNSVSEALLDHEITLIDAVEATGAVLVFENRIHTIGSTPPESFIKELVIWLNANMKEQLFDSTQLSTPYPAALAFKEQASGLLACRLSRELKEYLLWFRPEVVGTVTWAGDPNKPAEINPASPFGISPRKSFESWKETVELTSVDWTPEDRRSALQLKDEISFSISRKAAEIRLINERLKVAYDELDAFSYTISHDLKNPLSSIKSYAQLLPRKFNLEPNAQVMVDRIYKAAGKMQDMISEVLSYSQVGQALTNRKTIKMKDLLNELKDELQVASTAENLVIHIGNTEEVEGDETMVQQVFSNLLGNAVKYSSKSEHPEVHVSATDLGDVVQYAVSDNGVGIKHHDQFSRSAEVGDFEGSGVGLSIVKKIMDKHEGKIWVESDGESGSTFYVQFKKPA
jgi:chemotaxis family two-component system sensor kinase Cph1